MSEKPLYAAYGSNMNVEQMKHRCPDAALVGVGKVENYKLVFAYHGVATIVPAKSESVSVVLWQLTENCEAALDTYEGFPRLYGKQMIRVNLGNSGEAVEAMAYIMNEPYSKFKQYPTAYYLNIILKGYKDNGVDIPLILKEQMHNI